MRMPIRDGGGWRIRLSPLWLQRIDPHRETYPLCKRDTTRIIRRLEHPARQTRSHSQKRSHKMRIAIFDIETSTFGFKANSGFILCCGIKELGKPIKMLVRDNMQPDPLNDKKLVTQIYDELSKMDMVVGHNIKWFDMPFINSRLLRA